MQTATVSWTTGMSVDVAVITVSGADQTTPVTNGTFVATASAPAVTTSLTITSNPGDLTSSVAATNGVWKTPYTNQLKKWGIDGAEAGGDVGRGTGTTTHTWTDTWSGTGRSISGANFKTAVPDFTMSSSPSSQTVVQGTSTSYNLTTAPLNGFSAQINFSVSGLPSGAAGAFSPNPATGSSTLSVTTTASTPTGSYTLTITGTSGPLSHSATATMVVVPPFPDFTLSSSPSSQTVLPGNPVAYNLAITPIYGFSDAVNLSVAGLPGGASGSFNPNPATGSSTLTVTTGTGTLGGTYSLTITGVSGALMHTATVSLIVTPPDFTLTSSPSSLTIGQGAAATYTVAITPMNGFGNQVNLSISGLPAGASATFTPNPASNSSTLSVTTGTNTPGGSFSLTITGTSGSLNHTTVVSLVITGVVIADLFNNAEAGNPGDVLSVALLNASTQGSGGAWTTSNVSKFYTNPPNMGVFARSITIAGASYDGTGSRSWDYDHSVDSQFAKYQIPAGRLKASVGMFLQPGPNGTWGTYDFLELQGVNGMDCIIQMFDGTSPSTHNVWAHSAASSYGTQIGVAIPVTANQTYWVSLQYDGTAGTCSVAVFDPVTFVQIGVTSIVPMDANVNVGPMIVGANGHGVTTSAHSYYDNIILDWTAGAFPVVPR
jgi:hypothetical protein